MDLLKKEDIEAKIFTIRNIQVMLDSDLAVLYGTETKIINRAVKRNPIRFPESFVFQLRENEWESLRFQIGTLNENIGRGQHRKYLPWVFTEQGVSMLSTVLNTETAIRVSIQIMQTFIAMRKFLMNNISVFNRLENLELKQIKTDEKIEQILKALESGKVQSDKGIFFEGQIFDAYLLVANIIKQAKTDIILIDNYIDETVLTLLSKRSKQVTATIYTNHISKQLLLDLKKHNSQYPNITIKPFLDSHDRFLILDNKELYHLGASLKDLGKKWFAFSKMDSLTADVLTKLNKTN